MEEPMRIAIVGAGRVGRALGAGWTRRGRAVVYGVRDPEGGRHRDLAPNLATPAAAAAKADVVAIATPWDATEAAIGALGDLSGKIAIDCTNPLAVGPEGLGLAQGYTNSGAELVAGWAKGASVFKAFNSTGSDNMADLSAYPRPPVMFVAGDDAAHKPIVMDLARDIGFEAVDAGPLRIARLLEPLAMLWIDQAVNRGAGHDFAFALVRKPQSR
jgi:8-hydroxy-5-deazaflavin:NADPH oxidoreductase